MGTQEESRWWPEAVEGRAGGARLHAEPGCWLAEWWEGCGVLNSRLSQSWVNKYNLYRTITNLNK